MPSNASKGENSVFAVPCRSTIVGVALACGCVEALPAEPAAHPAEPAAQAATANSEPVGLPQAPGVNVPADDAKDEPKEVWDIEAAPIEEEVRGPWKPPAPVPLAKPLARVPIAPDDPEHGHFTLAQATQGLAEKGQLLARLTTGQGTIDCELWPHRAPITVANFVGLARGLRPFKDPRSQSWVKRPAYDGTVFHRVIPGFMIQGGDPMLDGTGTGGYVIPDENWQGATHNAPGLLCMATQGPNTGSMQFFITEHRLSRDLSYLDGSYTVFGECLQTEVVERIARVKAYGDRPETPQRIQKVEVVREVPTQ